MPMGMVRTAVRTARQKMVAVIMINLLSALTTLNSATTTWVTTVHVYRYYVTLLIR